MMSVLLTDIFYCEIIRRMGFLCWIRPGILPQVRVKLSLVDQDGIHEVGFCVQVCVSLRLIRNRRFRGGPYV
jgi:hypothetical protein